MRSTDKAAKLLAGPGRDRLAALAPVLQATTDWTAASLEAAVRAHVEATGVKLGDVAQPLRAALTGKTESPGLFEVMEVLGRDESLARIGDVAGLNGVLQPLRRTRIFNLAGLPCELINGTSADMLARHRNRTTSRAGRWMPGARAGKNQGRTRMAKPTGTKGKNETVTLTDNLSGKQVDFPLLSGTIGPKVIDIRKLYARDRLLHLRSRLHRHRFH